MKPKWLLACIPFLWLLSAATSGGEPAGTPEPDSLAFSLRPIQLSGDREGLAIDLGEYGQVPLNCVDADTVAARQLGDSNGPVIVEWKGHVQGRWQFSYYLVLDPVHAGEVLLHGSIQLIGSAGAGNFLRQALVFRVEGNILERRVESVESGRGDERVYEYIDVDRFRHEPGQLNWIEGKRAYKIQQGDEFADVCKKLQMESAWALEGGRSRDVGEWLEFRIPVPESRVQSTPPSFKCSPAG